MTNLVEVKKPPKMTKQELINALQALKELGVIDFDELGENTRIHLTEKGRKLGAEIEGLKNELESN